MLVLTSLRPTLLLDVDGVLCLNRPYGCLHARFSQYRPHKAPPGIWQQLFSADAVSALGTLVDEFQPSVVLTTSWQALMEREHFFDVFTRTGLPEVARSFHSQWAAPQNRNQSRLDSIGAWMRSHHRGEPILVLDDHQSGHTLVGSQWEASGQQVLCDEERGFHSGLLPAARRAFLASFGSLSGVGE